MRLSEIIVKCLAEHGELSAQEITQTLNVPLKAVTRALGHMRRKGIVERGTPIRPVYETPYGPYQSHYLAGFKWKLKEEKRR